VAVKRLLRDDSKAFNRESTILRRLLKKPLFHSHLITLLATFEQRGQRYLIFPWAERDLENYWKSMHSGKDEQLAIWLVRQCQGITEALSHIHRYHTTSGTTMDYKSPDESSAVERVSATQQTYDPPNIRRPLTLFGRHGDIRPKNILWYHDPANIQDLGTLKLADFGCARFRDTTRMPEEKRSSMAISWTYVSPECVIPDNIPSIQCDVWALGCVFLEFICWYHTGYNGLHTFDRQRIFENASDNFFHIVRHGKPERSPLPYAAVKETVIEVSTRITVAIHHISG
jgi:serine/threonine protein kinase